MNASLTSYWFLRKKDEWNLCYPMGRQMNKLLDVYYFLMCHGLSRYPIGFQFHPSSAHWEALGLTIQLGCLGEKRGYSFGLGWVRGLVKGVSGDNGRMEWQLVGVLWHVITIQCSWSQPYLFSLWNLVPVINFLELIFLCEKCVFQVTFWLFGPGANAIAFNEILLFFHILKLAQKFKMQIYIFL